MNTWQTKKLGDITEINGGGTPPTSKTEYFSGDIPWFTPSEITSGTVSVLNNSQRQITEDAMRFTKVAEQGTVLLSSRATIGNVGIVSDRSTYNQGIKGLTPKKELSHWYLAYWLLANKKRLESQSHGTTFKELSTTALKKFDISVPPLSIQQQIVEKINAIRKLQELNNKEIEKAVELFKTQLSNCFKWQEQWKKIKLAEICDVRDGTHDSPKYQPSGIPLITSKNLKEDLIDFTNINYISEKDHQQIVKRSFVENGDILFGMIGTIGNPVIVDTERTFSIKNVGLIKFPNRKIVNNLFVKYFLQSPSLEIEIKRLSRGGTQKFVSLGNLRNLLVPLPSLKEQEKIAMELNNIRLFNSKLNLKGIKLSELFESALNKFMKRELIN
jgi:type I restriction enzyme S subunit